MHMKQKIVAALICSALSPLGLSCSDSQEPSEEGVGETGTISFPLVTQGQSGTVYQLRNATFEIRDRRTGRVRATLQSDDEPSNALMRAEVDAGDYVVELLPGWLHSR